jgi:hypothetical protein
MRSKPPGGYDFSRKRDYRRKVWATFRDTLKRQHVSIAESHALLMPSLEGDEIDVALNAGFREEHLHVIDREPAIVATLKKRYGKINTYGVTASKAFERLSKEGTKIRCANLDFCSQLSMPVGAEMAKIALLGNLPSRLTAVDRKNIRIDIDTEKYGDGVFANDCAVIAVSFLRGRESRKTTAYWTTDVSDQAVLKEREDAIADMRRMLDARQATVPPEVIERLLYGFRRFLELSEMDRHRVNLIRAMLSLTTGGINKLAIPQERKPLVQLLRTESYLSTSGQTMLWSVWELTSMKARMQQHNAANAKRVSMGMAPVQWLVSAL